MAQGRWLSAVVTHSCLVLSLIAAALPCLADLSGDAADYRFLDAPEEVQLSPVGVQGSQLEGEEPLMLAIETHRWGSKGHRLTVGFDSSRVLQGTAFQVAVRFDSELTSGPVKVTPRFVTNTNAWREEEETDDLYTYLSDLALQAASRGESGLEELGPDAAAAVAYSAAAPPRRLEQLSSSLPLEAYPPLLPPRKKKATLEGGESRRLEVCSDDFTEADEKKRDKLLKSAGFDENMECNAGVPVDPTRSRGGGASAKLQELPLPPEYLPPNSPGCKESVFCGLQYCSLVDCTRAVTRAIAGGENLLWIPNGSWEVDLLFDWAPQKVPLEGDLRVEVREVPPRPPGEMRLREKGEEEEVPGNLALLFAALPREQIGLTVSNAGFPNRPNVIGLFAAQLEFSFSLNATIPRVQGPMLRLRFPAVACGTRREALQSSEDPAWINQTLRECWDVHRTCLSMSGGGIFNSCEEGFVEMEGLEIRTITLHDPKADVKALVRAQPNDDYPFSVTYTFVAPEEIYKGGLELYIPQRTFLYDPGPRERYNPYTRQFFKVATADLPIRPTSQGTKVTLYPVTMAKGETLTVYLPLKAFSLASGAVWPAPQAVAYPEGADKEYSLRMSNLRRKPVAEVTRISAPVYTPGMVAAAMGPHLQSLDGQGTLVSFQLKFGEEIPSGQLKIWVTPMLNATVTSSGEIDKDVTGTCKAWFKSVHELVSQIECPENQGSFEFTLFPSDLAAQFVEGWVSLGMQLTKPMSIFPFFNIAVRDSASSLVYSVDLPTGDTYQNPCIQRFSSHLIKPRKTGYSAKLLLVLQVVNCNNPAEPLKAMEGQVEPLGFALPDIHNLNKIDHISSVSIERTSHPEQTSLDRQAILLGLESKSGSFFTASQPMRSADSAATKKAAGCTQEQEEGDACSSRSVKPPPSTLDPPGHINPSFSPKYLPRDPRLAAASVHLTFPHPRGFGRVEEPVGFRDVPQQRNPLATHASKLAGVPQQAVRIVVDLVVDAALGLEATLMISDWGFQNFYHTGGEWCSARGMECYGHDWTDAGVFQWGARDPKPAVGELPEEWKAVRATSAIQPVIEWRQSVSCNEIPPHLSVVILLTEKKVADEYEALLRQKPLHALSPEWEDRPVHVHVIGFEEISYKPLEDPLKPLKEVPVTDTTNMIRAALVDNEMSLVAEERVLVSFSSAMPLAGQYEGDALISKLEEALLLVTEEFAQSIVTVEICRHPVPPPGYEFPWASQRDELDPTYRAIEITYNGEPLKKMVEFHIPKSEIGVYTPAKLDWQFRMACDGDFNPADCSPGCVLLQSSDLTLPVRRWGPPGARGGSCVEGRAALNEGESATPPLREPSPPQTSKKEVHCSSLRAASSIGWRLCCIPESLLLRLYKQLVLCLSLIALVEEELLKLRRGFWCWRGGGLLCMLVFLAAPSLLKHAALAEVDETGAPREEDPVEAADVGTKVVAAALIFMCAVLGAVPGFVVLRRQQQQQTEGLLSQRSNSCPVPPACCSSNYGAAATACCFGASPFYVRAATVFTAGVVAAVALLHLLPAADRRLTGALNAFTGKGGGALWGRQYPAAALCCLIGLLLSAALEAVVEQQQQQQQQQEDEADEETYSCMASSSTNSVDKEGAPSSGCSSLQLSTNPTPTAGAAGEAAAEGGGQDSLGPVRLPVSMRNTQGAPLQGQGAQEPSWCLSNFRGPCPGGGPCEIQISSAPPGNMRRASAHSVRSGAEYHHHHRCCHETSCCSGFHTSMGGKGMWQLGRMQAPAAPDAAAPIHAPARNSSEVVGSEPRALSCPYTLMDEAAVSSAPPPQQGKRMLLGADAAAGEAPSSSSHVGGKSGIVGSLLLTGLSLHSLMEGFTLGMAPNPKTVAIAILLHKTLEAFAVGSSLLHVRAALGSYVVQMLFYALTAPLGVAAGLCLQLSVSSQATTAAAAACWRSTSCFLPLQLLISLRYPEGLGGVAAYVQLIPGLLIGLGAGAFLHVGLLEILASEMQRCRREKRGDMLRMIGLTAVGALCMALRPRYYMQHPLASNYREATDRERGLLMMVYRRCGSGCVTSFLASLLHQLAKKEQNRENHFPIFFAVDKQQEALDATRLTLKHNNPGVSLELLRCDLFQAFKKPFLESKLSTGPCAVKEEGKRDVTCSKGSPINEGPFDLILFNPPYVPGSPRGVVASEDLPWWGGVLGREVIDCFVDKVMEFLSPRGILYLLLERRNKPEEVVSMLEAKGCTGQLLASRKIRGEVLSIWRFSRVDYSLLADGFQASCLKPSK
ncbi:hypothetical protein Emed_001277 [Eimeria media]